jgi:hypothetical protein
MSKRITRWSRGGALTALALSVCVLSGCEDLLDVTLPSQLTDEVLEDPGNAGILVNSFIAAYEDAWTTEHYNNQGREAQGEIHLCGPCAPSFQGINSGALSQMARAARFSRDLYDKLADDWTVQQVPLRARYMALSSLYQGMVLTWAGSSLCEYSPNGGELQTAAVTLDQGITMLQRALTEINAAGDFQVQNGIATSARTMTNGLLAHAMWMKGDLTGAAAAAALVPNGFFAYVTRESGPARRNDYFYDGTNSNYLELYDPIDWWKSPIPNPATGQVWPAVIPFTGSTYLGIMPDGRAVDDNGTAIRTQAGPPPWNNAIGVKVGAVPDPRVTHRIADISGKGGVGAISTRWKNEGDDLPIVNWKEMLLIRAEAAGGQAAIDFVNQIRSADNLARVTYITGATATPTQIRYMIMEEKRRVLFGEGRYFYTMLRNPDVNWFPRNQGGSRAKNRNLGGGVRYIMPNNEYVDNRNLSLEDRATGCRPAERPILS